MPHTHPNYEERADQIYLDMLKDTGRCGDKSFYVVEDEIREYFYRLAPTIRLIILAMGLEDDKEPRDSLLSQLRDFLYKEALAQAQREKR